MEAKKHIVKYRLLPAKNSTLGKMYQICLRRVEVNYVFMKKIQRLNNRIL